MTQTMIRHSIRAALLSLAALAVVAPALAAEDEVEGRWKLQTNEFDDGCEITGSIQFTQKSKNAYSCKFTSSQICYGAGKLQKKGKPVSMTTVEQSCTATRVGKQVAIKTVVDRIVKTIPDDPLRGYYADNFILGITKPGREMVGGHYDEVRQLKARFWRDIDLIS